MQVDTLQPPARIFLSRNLQGEAGENLVEKQNAEQGLMPVLADEGFSYGYLHDGLLVTELLMAAYLSAELGETLSWPVTNLEAFVPAVAREAWDPRVLPSHERSAT